LPGLPPLGHAHAFRLLFIFASKRLGIRPSQICLEQIDAALILEFLAHIEEERGNCAATRNGRLAAVKAFIRYVEFRVPFALAQARQIHAIPGKRHDQALVRHLTMEEVRAILNAPNLTTRLGIRDRAMLQAKLDRLSDQVRMDRSDGDRGDYDRRN